MYRAVLVLFAASVLAACSGPRPAARPDLPDTFPYHAANEIQQHLLGMTDTLFAFQAKASMSIRSPERSGSFSATLRNRRGDSLFMSISPGLGIEAARALLTPDSFFVYDRIKSRLLYGSLEDAGEALPALPTAEGLFQNLLGLIVPDPGIPWEVTADSSHYYLTDAAGRRTYTVDPAFWRVVRYTEVDDAGELVEERRFAEFDAFQGQYLPRRIVFLRPRENAVLSLFYRDLTLNPAGLTFGLHVKDSVDRERVGGP